jgi:hypothetical protein
MSFATGMLAQAQTAHANALKDKMTQMDDRLFNKLRLAKRNRKNANSKSTCW